MIARSKFKSGISLHLNFHFTKLIIENFTWLSRYHPLRFFSHLLEALFSLLYCFSLSYFWLLNLGLPGAFPSVLIPLIISSSLMALNIIPMRNTPKRLSLAQTFLLNSRLCLLQGLVGISHHDLFGPTQSAPNHLFASLLSAQSALAMLLMCSPLCPGCSFPRYLQGLFLCLFQVSFKHYLLTQGFLDHPIKLQYPFLSTSPDLSFPMSLSLSSSRFFWFIICLPPLECKFCEEWDLCQLPDVSPLPKSAPKAMIGTQYTVVKFMMIYVSPKEHGLHVMFKKTVFQK